MRKLLNHLFVRWNRYKRFATILLLVLLTLNTFLVYITGGIPSAFAHTMYIPVLIASLYYGYKGGILVGIISGLLVGPFMAIGAFDVGTEPFSNSFYRLLYFAGIGGVVGVLFTYLQNRMDELHTQTEELSKTLMSIGDGVVITDNRGVIERINQPAADMLGIRAKDAEKKAFGDVFHLIQAESRNRINDPVLTAIKTGKNAEIDRQTLLIDASGNERYIEDIASPIMDKEENLIGVVLVFRDVTKRTMQEKEIRHLSNHDHLTNIPNHRHFHQKLDSLDQKDFYPLGIVYFDLDGLKLINDAYGHASGDQALKQVAKILKASERDNDFAARIGGDEFAMICPNADEETMEALRATIDKKIKRQKVQGVRYSLATGYALKKDARQTIRSVLSKAENRMYKNKVLSGKSTRNQAIKSILETLTNKYEEERVHSKRVGEFCREIGASLGLRQDEVKELELAGQLHDIGKITIPDAILGKPGKLNEKEWATMKEHTVAGYQILRASDEYSKLADYAMSHHERVDGTGYPNESNQEQIPFFSKIISVADAYEAMTSDRPYRKALPVSRAKEELRQNRGTQFDAEIVDVFLEDVLPNIANNR